MKSILTKIKGFFLSLDIVLLFLCLSCSTISMACMYSFYETGEIKLSRVLIQLAAVLLGILAALVLSMLDYEFMAKLWKFHAPAALLLVMATFVFGIAPNPNAPDDRAWLDLGITTFQPSELLKISFILTFAYHLSKVSDNINHLKPFLLLCLHGAVPVVLVGIQGDLGTASVFLTMFIVMMFVAGLSVRWIVVGVAAAAAAAPFIWFFVLSDTLRNRFLVALHPETDPLDKGMQQYLGRITFGSGSLFGRGLASPDIYNPVPEAYNDFIFSYIGQTLGFVGVVITLLLILLLCVKILMTSKMAKDRLGMFICIGVFTMLLFQSAINIGMVLCVVPVIGITLPLFSLGGTSSLITYMAIGLVLSVYRQNKKDLMFD